MAEGSEIAIRRKNQPRRRSMNRLVRQQHGNFIFTAELEPGFGHIELALRPAMIKTADKVPVAVEQSV